jgi:hypothetical protein
MVALARQGRHGGRHRLRPATTQLPRPAPAAGVAVEVLDLHLTVTWAAIAAGRNTGGWASGEEGLRLPMKTGSDACAIVGGEMGSGPSDPSRPRQRKGPKGRHRPRGGDEALTRRVPAARAGRGAAVAGRASGGGDRAAGSWARRRRSEAVAGAVRQSGGRVHEPARHKHRQRGAAVHRAPARCVCRDRAVGGVRLRAGLRAGAGAGRPARRHARPAPDVPDRPVGVRGDQRPERRGPDQRAADRRPAGAGSGRRHAGPAETPGWSRSCSAAPSGAGRSAASAPRWACPPRPAR